MSYASYDLTGPWQFKQYPVHARRMQDLDTEPWQETVVPCSIFHSLVDAGTITRRDVDTSPEKLAWVNQTPWIYSKNFELPVDFKDAERIELVFEGLDTFASIWLNEKLLARTANMFMAYRFDVTTHLKGGSNRILVKFDAAQEHAGKLMQRYSSLTETAFRNPARTFVRKAQYQFGWDFCPAMQGCGIWRPCRLEAIKHARIEDVYVRTIDANAHFADIRIAVKLDASAASDFSCTLNISAGSLNIAHDLKFSTGQDFQSAVIRIDRPFLWWPRGYGIQYLYSLKADLSHNGMAVDHREMQFGIRTVKLNRAADEYGPNMSFEINGQPIYIKGAAWTPATITPGRLEYNDYQQLLAMAAYANINLLRVWGGGYYESPQFYELCDKFGIMVWQDFMFAAGAYPDKQWFLDEVASEATAVIKSLRNYACIALWCGNADVDAMYAAGTFGKAKKAGAKEIFHEILQGLVTELDTGRDYIPTCPAVSKTPDANPLAHQWRVWKNQAPVRDYILPAAAIPRFVSEFGFGSPLLAQTVKDVLGQIPKAGSESFEKLNYELDGNSRIYRYCADLFGPVADHGEFIYKSQLAQARALKTLAEYLRVHNFKNNGMILWNFADCAAAISDSLLDVSRNPKPAYFYARRFYSPILITAVPEYEKVKFDEPPIIKALSVYAVNDSAGPLTAEMAIRLLDLSGRVLDQISVPLAMSPYSLSTGFKLPKGFVNPDKPSQSVLHLMLMKNDVPVTQNIWQYTCDKYIAWQKPKFEIAVSKSSDTNWKIRLKSDVVAKDVCLTVPPPVRLLDNIFDIFPGCDAEFTALCPAQCSLNAEMVTITSLGSL